jgi:hypothetical protein
MLFVERSKAGSEVEVSFEENKRKERFAAARLGTSISALEGGKLGSRMGKTNTKLPTRRVIHLNLN